MPWEHGYNLDLLQWLPGSSELALGFQPGCSEGICEDTAQHAAGLVQGCEPLHSSHLPISCLHSHLPDWEMIKQHWRWLDTCERLNSIGDGLVLVLTLFLLVEVSNSDVFGSFSAHGGVTAVLRLRIILSPFLRGRRKLDLDSSEVKIKHQILTPSPQVSPGTRCQSHHPVLPESSWPLEPVTRSQEHPYHPSARGYSAGCLMRGVLLEGRTGQSVYPKKQMALGFPLVSTSTHLNVSGDPVPDSVPSSLVLSVLWGFCWGCIFSGSEPESFHKSVNWPPALEAPACTQLLTAAYNTLQATSSRAPAARSLHGFCAQTSACISAGVTGNWCKTISWSSTDHDHQQNLLVLFS